MIPKSDNILWHAACVTQKERFELLGAKGATVWLTGLSGSGKSTVAVALEQALLRDGLHAFRLDGDNLRHGLNVDLGFSASDRQENIRRVSEVACLFAQSGTVVITSLISPYAKDRDACRTLHHKAGLRFFEVFVSTPLSVCESRDPKGLYKKARAGELKGFTGIDDPYEAPIQPELVLDTATTPLLTCVEKCRAMLNLSNT